MYIYKNGDICPLCGEIITGKGDEWLNDFSWRVAELGLKLDLPVLPITPPPDAGIYPPKPRREKF